MPQAVPLALVAPTRPGLADVGYLVRSAANYATILTNWTAVAEAGSNTGYYPVQGTISVPDAGCLIEFRRASDSGTFLSAVAVDPVPSNFTDMAITASTGQVTAASVTGSVASVTNPVTAGTVTDKTGYSLAQAFPANFASLAITAGGAVTAGTVTDKTGYSLSSAQTFNLTGNITGNLSGSVGSVTGSVGGSVGSVTGAVGSVNNPVTVGTNNDKTGYSLTQAFPPNFSSLAITPTTGRVTVGTNADKTGYGLEDNAITADKIATDAITSDKIAANAIGASEIAADAVTEIQSGLATQASLDTKASQASVDDVTALVL